MKLFMVYYMTHGVGTRVHHCLVMAENADKAVQVAEYKISRTSAGQDFTINNVIDITKEGSVVIPGNGYLMVV